MPEAHYDVTSNLVGYTCANAEFTIVKHVKVKPNVISMNPILCVKYVTKVICNKSFYDQRCLHNHKTNNLSNSHSCKCKMCNRFYTTRDLPMDQHKCNEIKCRNCKKYVNNDHHCYILKKDIKPHSDFETEKDPEK